MKLQLFLFVAIRGSGGQHAFSTNPSQSCSFFPFLHPCVRIWMLHRNDAGGDAAGGETCATVTSPQVWSTGGPGSRFLRVARNRSRPMFFWGRGPLADVPFGNGVGLMAKSGSAHGCSLPCTCRQKVEYIMYRREASPRCAHQVFPAAGLPFSGSGVIHPNPSHERGGSHLPAPSGIVARISKGKK